MNLNGVLVNSHTLTGEQHASSRTAATQLTWCLLIALFLDTHGARLTFFPELLLGPHLFALFRPSTVASFRSLCDLSRAGPFCISP